MLSAAILNAFELSVSVLNVVAPVGELNVDLISVIWFDNNLSKKQFLFIIFEVFKTLFKTIHIHLS
jgi:hypothetical protein